MNIAICDDDSKITDRLKGDIATFFICLNEDVEVSVFANGMELLYTIKKEENYDLILLDVDMPCMSGLEAAKQIRKNDEDVIIIFMSSYENYVFDSFEYNKSFNLHELLSYNDLFNASGSFCFYKRI